MEMDVVDYSVLNLQIHHLHHQDVMKEPNVHVMDKMETIRQIIVDSVEERGVMVDLVNVHLPEVLHRHQQRHLFNQQKRFR
jgi:hypothetical protein